MSSSRRDGVGYGTVRAVVLTLLSCFVLFPLYTMVTTALKPTGLGSGSFSWIPKQLGIGAFVNMWETAPLAKYFLNSFVVASIATLISVVLALFAAYALTRYNFRGKRPILYLVLSTQAFPGVVFLLPLFVLYSGLQRITSIQLIGSYTGMIIVDLTFAMPFSIWMLTNYLSTIPRDMEEAAMTDGCRRFGAFVRVTLPVALPGLAAVSVFVFISAWSELLFASVLADAHTLTLPVGLQIYLSPQANVVYWNQLMAASLLISAPIVVVFLAVQRLFVQGLGGGAVK